MDFWVQQYFLNWLKILQIKLWACSTCINITQIISYFDSSHIFITNYLIIRMINIVANRICVRLKLQLQRWQNIYKYFTLRRYIIMNSPFKLYINVRCHNIIISGDWIYNQSTFDYNKIYLKYQIDKLIFSIIYRF